MCQIFKKKKSICLIFAQICQKNKEVKKFFEKNGIQKGTRQRRLNLIYLWLNLAVAQEKTN
jgi:hypothetical protein